MPPRHAPPIALASLIDGFPRDVSDIVVRAQSPLPHQRFESLSRCSSPSPRSRSTPSRSLGPTSTAPIADADAGPAIVGVADAGLSGPVSGSAISVASAPHAVGTAPHKARPGVGHYSDANGQHGFVLDRSAGPKAKLRLDGSKSVVVLTPVEANLAHDVDLRDAQGANWLRVTATGKTFFFPFEGSDVTVHRDSDADPLP